MPEGAVADRPARWDVLVRGAKVFDGSGDAPVVEDVAVAGGRVAARGAGLDPARADRVVEGAGKWLTPGFVDVHTHYDLEVELSPGLPESVRHGVTTVVVANRSLGLAFGAQRENGQDPVVDCFARVENIPKPVLRRIADRVDWRDSADYLAHLETLALGPNIVPMIPYSMLRIEAMGLDASVTRDPTEAELSRMEALLEKGMEEGYAGFSSDALPFHYLSEDPHRERKIPAQYAGYAELKRLTNVVRRWKRVWQATPPSDDPKAVFRNFALTSGRLHGAPLKITAVAALDVASNRMIKRQAKFLATVMNSPLLKGSFHLQALAAPFKVWAEGPITPISEEIPELRRLNQPDIDDRAARRAILDDPAFIRDFRAMWRKGKSGFSLARLKRLLGTDEFAFTRDLADMTVENCPVAEWRGETLAAVLGRLKRFQAGADAARSQAERAAFAAAPNPIGEDADFFLHLLREYDRDLYWFTYSANRDPETVAKLVMDPLFLPGFSDAGAHIINLAFYDVTLRALKIAMEKKGEAGAAWMVKRLTSDPAELFGVAPGGVSPGERADMVLIDPEALARHDGVAETKRVWRDTIAHEQLVNRSDGVVAMTMIGGRIAYDGTGFTEAFEQVPMGRLLRAGEAAPATERAAA